jgi:hypothetical protein
MLARLPVSSQNRTPFRNSTDTCDVSSMCANIDHSQPEVRRELFTGLSGLDLSSNWVVYVSMLSSTIQHHFCVT